MKGYEVSLNSFYVVAKDKPDKYRGEICLLINVITAIIYKEKYMIVILSQIQLYKQR